MRRGNRLRKLPGRFADFVDCSKRLVKRTDLHPVPPAGLPPQHVSTPIVAAVPHSAPAEETESGSGAPAPKRFVDSSKNAFGVFRRFFRGSFPSHDPDSEIVPEDLHDASECPPSDGCRQTSSFPSQFPATQPYHPYPNKSSYNLGRWQNNGFLKKSKGEFKKLVRLLTGGEVIPSELNNVNWDGIDEDLASNPLVSEPTSASEPGASSRAPKDAGWKYSPITISVPHHSNVTDPGPGEYTIEPGLLHRSIVSVIREKVESPHHFANFHTEPYELYCQPDAEKPPIRLHGELYSSQAFLDAHETLQSSPAEDGCDLERVVAALMFSSDGTQLTQFGDTKLWPLYLAFGNDSKYRRTKPTNKLLEHIAFFEQGRNFMSAD